MSATWKRQVGRLSKSIFFFALTCNWIASPDFVEQMVAESPDDQHFFGLFTAQRAFQSQRQYTKQSLVINWEQDRLSKSDEIWYCKSELEVPLLCGNNTSST